uniref:Tub domain-containing protein n=1 Tax=Haemonchus contortus TaxID=6289 RepID=A0A7I4YUZ4_HAECO
MRRDGEGRKGPKKKVIEHNKWHRKERNNPVSRKNKSANETTKFGGLSEHHQYHRIRWTPSLEKKPGSQKVFRMMMIDDPEQKPFNAPIRKPVRFVMKTDEKDSNLLLRLNESSNIYVCVRKLRFEEARTNRDGDLEDPSAYVHKRKRCLRVEESGKAEKKKIKRKFSNSYTSRFDPMGTPLLGMLIPINLNK